MHTAYINRRPVAGYTRAMGSVASRSVVAITIQKTKRPNFLYAKTVVRDAMNPPFQPNVNEQISSAQVPRVPLAAAAPPGENCDSRITIDGRMCGATAALQVGRTKLRHHSPLQNDRPTDRLFTVCTSLEIGQSTCLPNEEEEEGTQ